MEPQAQAFYNILQAMFDYADANFEPKGVGLISPEEMAMMVEKANMPELLPGLHTLELIISQNPNASTLYTIVHKLPASVQAELYKIMEC